MMGKNELDFRLEMMDDESLTQSLEAPALQGLDKQLSAIQRLFSEEKSISLEALAKYKRAWTRSHLQEGHYRQVVELAKRARADFSVLVTVGIGGSDLSARVFHDVLNPAYHNLLSVEDRGGAPEVYFAGDTFDPFRLKGLLEMLTQRGLLDRTLFNVISKSGRTGETISALMIVRDWLTRHGKGADSEAWRRQVVATTGLDASSALYELHQKHPFYGNTLLPVPDGVGGRFSVFSPVGMFFLAMTAGKGETSESRVQEMAEGVQEAEVCWGKAFGDDENVAYGLARWLHLQEAICGKGTLVFYNFADNRCLGDWFVQLYDESVQERGSGLNVISARGPTSNHSILNGIVGGPRDKMVLFVQWGDLGSDLTIPEETGIGGELEAFGGLSMGQVQTASCRGTVEDFTAHGIPNTTLHVAGRDAKNLGALMRMLMDAVAVKGRLQDLHVNDAGEVDQVGDLTYLQDGVEGYKKRTREQAVRIKSGS